MTNNYNRENANYSGHVNQVLRQLGIRNGIVMEYEPMPPPASPNVVNTLPVTDIYIKGSNCVICLNEIEVKEKILTMPCKHYFHADCILRWLKRTNSCPICRLELLTDDAAYEKAKQEKILQERRGSNTLTSA